MRARRHILSGLLLLCAPLASAGTPALIELGRHVPGYGTTGPAGMVVADFDGDGLDDLVVPAQSGTSLFQVFGQGASGIVSKQVVFVPDDALVGASVAVIGGAPNLVTVSIHGVVRRFAGWPLVEVQSFDMQALEVGAAAVGDIDNDGELELVYSLGYFSTSVEARTLLDGALEWSLPLPESRGLLLRQFDADPALEIVLSGVPGRVIDGATQATDWSYKDGFGFLLAAGEFKPGGGLEFAAVNTWGPIVGFQSAPWSPVWDLEQFDVFALASADFDGDGFDEIIEADGSWGAIHIIDGQSLAVRIEIPHGGMDPVSVVAWDHDGVGGPDVAAAAYDPTWYGKPMLRLGDATDASTIWELPADRRPGFQPLAMARTAAGFSLAWGFGTHTNYGGWAEMDASNGQERWRSPTGIDSQHPFYMQVRDTIYANGGTQLVVAGAPYSYSVRFISLDPVTHATQWLLDGEVEPALLNRVLLQMTPLDVAGTPMIAACVDTGSGKRMLLIDAAAGTLAWTSVIMADNGVHCDVIAGRFSDGANPLVVAVMDASLRAFDTVTHLLAWTLPGPVDGASLIENGVSGRELAVFKGSELRFHDAGTRELLRSFDLGARITAVLEVNGDLHGLLVAAGGRLLLVDGSNGAILHATGYLGDRLAEGNRIATVSLGGGYTLVAVGSEGGVFRYRLYTGDGIFDDGFESIVD